MIKSINDFLVHFKAIASNFDWQWSGSSICAYKNGRYYDPITALVQIAKGEYIKRQHIEIASKRLGLPTEEFDVIINCLYAPDYSNKVMNDLRKQLEMACKLLSEEAT